MSQEKIPAESDFLSRFFSCDFSFFLDVRLSRSQQKIFFVYILMVVLLWERHFNGIFLVREVASSLTLNESLKEA